MKKASAQKIAYYQKPENDRRLKIAGKGWIEEDLRFQAAIVSNMGEGVVVVRFEDGKIVYANPAFEEELLGYNAGELFGKNISIINSTLEKSSEETAAETMAVLKKHKIWHGEIQNIKKDGVLLWCDFKITTFEHSRFGPVWISIQEDITESKAAEEEIIRLNADLEDRVQARTMDLRIANKRLETEVKIRRRSEETAEKQADIIRKLSTPILQVKNDILILPIVGPIDTERARQLTENLLEGISKNRAKAAVLDITGVPEVDSSVANYLIQAVKSARLLGAEVIITGISTDNAQTMTRIGVDLNDIRTLGTLQDGIEAI